MTRIIAAKEFEILQRLYPAAKTELQYSNPFELLIAVILSAQCTDVRVNLTTPVLFARYPGAEELCKADISDVERIVKSCGFYRMKAKNIVATARDLFEKYGGRVPEDRAALEALAGVGRKTASVVLSVAFEKAAFAVDTHVFRVAHRLGLTLGKSERDVERDVTKLLPPEKWRHAHHWLILHGRAICKAPTPRCEICPVQEICPSRKIVEQALAKTAKVRRQVREVVEVARPRQSTAKASKPSSDRHSPHRSKASKDS
ncbi:MAG: endonuclease III [Vulcanimicrobiaceae bacterium]